MRTGFAFFGGPDAAASAALASHQFPLELPPPLAGAGVIGHAERAVVDRFLAALHGGDGRRHQQVRQFADGALAACEQVAAMSSVAIDEGRRNGAKRRSWPAVSSNRRWPPTGSIIGSKRFSNWSSERMAR